VFVMFSSFRQAASGRRILMDAAGVGRCFWSSLRYKMYHTANACQAV
jgi:hypothetical protein